MPRVLYGNIIWFAIVMGAIFLAALSRHESEFWDSMPDVRRNYDLLFVGVFGAIFLISSIGIILQKKWGYEFTVSFNYLLAFLSFIPLLGLIFYFLKEGIPLSELTLEMVKPNIDNAIISCVSLIFALLIRRDSVSSHFENM